LRNVGRIAFAVTTKCLQRAARAGEGSRSSRQGTPWRDGISRRDLDRARMRRRDAAGVSSTSIPFHAYPETWTSAGGSISNDTWVRNSRMGSFERWTGIAAANRSGINEMGICDGWRSFAARAGGLVGAREAIGDAPNYHLGLTTDRPIEEGCVSHRPHAGEAVHAHGSRATSSATSGAARAMCLYMRFGGTTVDSLSASLDEISGANDRDFRHTPG
jgi:hypothetical protein